MFSYGCPSGVVWNLRSRDMPTLIRIVFLSDEAASRSLFKFSSASLFLRSTSSSLRLLRSDSSAMSPRCRSGETPLCVLAEEACGSCIGGLELGAGFAGIGRGFVEGGAFIGTFLGPVSGGIASCAELLDSCDAPLILLRFAWLCKSSSSTFKTSHCGSSSDASVRARLMNIAVLQMHSLKLL